MATPARSVTTGAYRALGRVSSVSAVRKRILFVDHTAAMSGGEIALLHLVRHLDRARYEPVVLLFDDGPLRLALERNGVETHCLPLTKRISATRKATLSGRALLRLGDAAIAAAFVLRVASLIRRLRVDLVHTNSLKADVIGGLACRLANRPVLWHIRDRIADDYLPEQAARAFRWLSRVLPTRVAANSQATLATLGDARGARREVVHDGVPSECFRKAEGDGSRSGGPRIGLVGRISPWKGQDVFVRAAAAIRQRFPTARFLIVGDALFDEREYEGSVRALVTSLGLEGSVEFTGFRADVMEVVASLDVLVHASTMPEPFGQVVIEGMAAGKPVVATAAGGVLEIVEDEVTGLTIPMGDPDAMAQAVNRLLLAPEVGRAMGRLGRQRVGSHFTIERVARDVQRIYDELLGRSGLRPTAQVLVTE